MSRRPILDLRSRLVRTVKVAVWDNEKGGLSMTLTKSSKNRSGEWEDSRINLFPADALAICFELRKALHFIDNQPFERSEPGAQAEEPRDYAASGPQPQQAPPAFDDDDIPF